MTTIRQSPSGRLVSVPEILASTSVQGYTNVGEVRKTLLDAGHVPGIYLLVPTLVIKTRGSAGCSINPILAYKNYEGEEYNQSTGAVGIADGNQTSIFTRGITSDGTRAIETGVSIGNQQGSPVIDIYWTIAFLEPLPLPEQ